MERANALVALGGEMGHTVPRYDLTPAEAVVLMAIHGDDAVHEIAIQPEDDDTETPTQRDEIARLREKYVATDPNTGEPIVSLVFPGRNPDLPKTFEELELPETAYKALQRATPAKAAAEAKAAAGAKAKAAQKKPNNQGGNVLE